MLHIGSHCPPCDPKNRFFLQIRTNQTWRLAFVAAVIPNVKDEVCDQGGAKPPIVMVNKPTAFEAIICVLIPAATLN